MSIAPLREMRAPLADGPRTPPRTLDATTSTPTASAAASAEGPSAFAELVHGLGHEVQRGEALMRSALAARNGDLGPAELIALQAGVYRYSEAVDLAAKLVDHATAGLKTIVQGQ